MADSISAPTGDMLVALSRSVTTGRLLSGVVHEVNNALLVISGTVELLEGQPDLPDAVVRGLERLRRQSARAASALGDVTSFTQASAAGQDRTMRAARALTQAAVDLRRFAATRAGVSLQFDRGTDPCLVRGNSGYLQQAILNLIINAEARHARHEGHSRSSTSACRVTGRSFACPTSVRASPGEAASSLPALRSSRPATDISGLALFAARAIAEAHGGTLALDAEVAGTSFVIRVPRGGGR